MIAPWKIKDRFNRFVCCASLLVAAYLLLAAVTSLPGSLYVLGAYLPITFVNSVRDLRWLNRQKRDMAYRRALHFEEEIAIAHAHFVLNAKEPE